MTSLVRDEKTPIYNLDCTNIKNSEFFYEKYKSNIENKEIYVITSSMYKPAEETKRLLEENNFEIVEKIAEYDYTELPYLHYLDKWEIYKVRWKEFL